MNAGYPHIAYPLLKVLAPIHKLFHTARARVLHSPSRKAVAPRRAAVRAWDIHTPQHGKPHVAAPLCQLPVESKGKTDSEQLIQAPAPNYPLETGPVSTANTGAKPGSPADIKHGHRKAHPGPNSSHRGRNLNASQRTSNQLPRSAPCAGTLHPPQTPKTSPQSPCSNLLQEARAEKCGQLSEKAAAKLLT